MHSSTDMQSPRVLGRYQLVRQIGKGGMGTVYEAYHPLLKKSFALKTLLDPAAALPEARARFLREAEAAARIDHPNVVHVTDVGSEGSTPYLVMEYLEGQTLAELLATQGPLPLAAALDVLLPVISAVAAAHALGVIHRDLKPENIFLARTRLGDACPKILDFGISKLADAAPSTLTGPQVTLGTAAYMSPEQARGARDVGAASDQYSLGLILYELIGGTRGHRGQNTLEILHNISCLGVVRLRHLQPSCPQALEDVVMRMLAPVPEYRFPSVAQAGAALLGFAGEKARTAHEHAFDPPVPPPLAPDAAAPRADPRDLPTRPAQRRGWRGRPIAIVSVGVALSAALLFFTWSGRRPPRDAAPAQASVRAGRLMPAPVAQPLEPALAPPAAESLVKPAAGGGQQARPHKGVAAPPTDQREHPVPAGLRSAKSKRGIVAEPSRGSHREETVFDPAKRLPSRPRRGANDALIIE